MDDINKHFALLRYNRTAGKAVSWSTIDDILHNVSYSICFVSSLVFFISPLLYLSYINDYTNNVNENIVEFSVSVEIWNISKIVSYMIINKMVALAFLS